MQAEDEANKEVQAEVRLPALKAFLQLIAEQVRGWRKHIDRHVTAALLMVVISILAAIAAFEVALAEQVSVGLERRLSIGQLEDASFRQGFYAEVVYRVGLEGQARILGKETDELARAKTGFFAGDRVASNWFDWRMAELRAQKNALGRFQSELASFDDSSKTPSVQIAERSARELRSKGFAAAVEESDVKFPALEQALAKAHKAAPALAFCVLLFVAALVCLTIAELDFGTRRLWWSLTVAAIVLAFAGTIQMALIDPILWIIAPLAVAMCAALPLAIRLGLFSRKGGPKPLLHPENPEPARPAFSYLAGHAGSEHDPWSRNIVALIAASVFFSAVFAWAYSVAVKEEGVAALSAQETRTEFVTRQGTSVTLVAGGIFDSVIQALSLRTRCAAATQFAILINDRVISGNFESAEKDREEACGKLKTVFTEDGRERVFASMDNNGLIDSAARPAFALRQDLIDRSNGPNSLLALADAKTAMSARWSDRAAAYLAVLTVLAIVLFLFAQAHSMGHTSAGRMLRGAAIGLLVVSLGFGAVANLGDGVVSEAKKKVSCVGDRKLATAEDVAKLGAEKYELGVAARDRGATSAPGSPERSQADAEALANLKCATLLLPDFIPAYQRYDEALSRIGSPQRAEDWLSLSNLSALKEMHQTRLAELRAASRAGLLRSSARLSNFAFNATAYALVEGNRDALSDARTAVDALIHRDTGWGAIYKRWQRPELFTDEDKIPFEADWFNLGLLSLASGEPQLISDAPRLYDQALAKEQHVSVTHAASALVDLELVRSYCKNLHNASTCDRIEAALEPIRAGVANLATRAELSTNSPATADGFAIKVTPYSVEWRAKVDSFDVQRDRLAVVWYRDETAEDAGGSESGWHVRRALQNLMESYRPDGNHLPVEAASAAAGHVTHVPLAAGYCLGPGRYVAELFLNGKLTGSASVVLTTAELSAVRSRELDLTGCVPPTWERYGGNSQEWRADAPARTFALNVDGRSKFGAAIATFYAPADMPKRERQQYFLRRTIQLMLKKGETPSQWRQDTEDGLVERAVNVDDLNSECETDAGLLFRFIAKDPNQNAAQVAIVSKDLANLAACPIIKSFTNYAINPDDRQR